MVEDFMKHTGIIKGFVSGDIRKFLLWIFFNLVLMSWFLFVIVPADKLDLLIILHVIVIIVSWLFFTVKTQRKYTIFKSILVFFMVFFGYVPISDIATQNTYWNGPRLSQWIYLFCSILSVALLFVFIFAYFLGSRIKHKSQKSRLLVEKKYFLYRLLLVSIVSSSIIYMSTPSFMSLFIRGFVDTSGDAVLSNSSSLIRDVFVRSLIPMCFLFSLSRGSLGYSDTIIKFILFALMITFCFPAGMPRYQAAAYYLPLVLFWLRKSNNPYMIGYLLIFGLVVVLPLLEQFRNFNSFEDLNFRISGNYFTAGHFDVYYNFVLGLSNLDIAYGYQLLGVLLFFVPRVLWPAKPVHSGQLFSTELGLNFDNVSFTLAAEGYVNFGIFGSFLFIFLAGFLCARIDGKFWRSMQQIYFFPVYAVLISMAFFMMRGSLLPTFAYTCGMICSFYFVSYLSLKRINH